MHGSSSFKPVLPLLAPDMRYENLVISEDIQAMEVFMRLVDVVEPVKIEHIRGDLWRYWKLDTLALVRILGELRRVCGF